jgi:anti-anti-sigma factor
MDLAHDEMGDICRIRLQGKLDLPGTEQIEVRFTALTSNREKLVIDLSQVDYIASIGLRMFVMMAKAVAKRGGKAALFGASPLVAKVIVASGLGGILPLHDTWDSAAAAVS